MATAAEPRPAELPLRGGRERATVRLHPLLTGRMIGPRAWFLREQGRLAWRKALGIGVPKADWLSVPVPAFLVEHPGAGALLIDTGFHPSVAVNPKQNLGRVALFTFKDLTMNPDQAVSAQLRARGIEPASIGTVVMTHLHIDHASAIAEYPQATFVVARGEWEAATSKGQLDGYVQRQFDHAFDYRLLDFEGDADASSFAGFARTFDLFGDGSVRCVYTPGHTLGHMSVVLRTAAREVLVVGDALYMRATLDASHLPYRTADEHLFRRSLREIQQYVRETPDALVIPSHDWEIWSGLEESY
ncbi:MAG TPA: N-acyl homoserine lactonase family protein [Thermoleophilaceae bacterium]|nr:N-acyl homoserine lactonase family protein [Thermoleophilaceae bacterium]